MQANLFIEQARTNSGRVVVHCSKGISRSSAITLGYCVNKLNLNVNDALLELK